MLDVGFFSTWMLDVETPRGGPKRSPNSSTNSLDVQCHIPGLMMISNPKHAAITYAPQYRGGNGECAIVSFPLVYAGEIF